MHLRKFDQTCDEMHFYLNQSLETGILYWQELAYLDFQDLILLVRRKNAFTEESE